MTPLRIIRDDLLNALTVFRFFVLPGEMFKSALAINFGDNGYNGFYFFLLKIIPSNPIDLLLVENGFILSVF